MSGQKYGACLLLLIFCTYFTSMRTCVLIFTYFQSVYLFLLISVYFFRARVFRVLFLGARFSVLIGFFSQTQSRDVSGSNPTRLDFPNPQTGVVTRNPWVKNDY